MRHTQDMAFALMKLLRAQELLDSGSLGDSDAAKLRAFIEAQRAVVPQSVLSHVERIRSDSVSGVGVVKNCACSVCEATLSEGELEYISKSPNVGLCENCFSFLVSEFPPDFDTFLSDILSPANEQ